MLSSPPETKEVTTTTGTAGSGYRTLVGVLVVLALTAGILVLTCVVIWYNGPAGPDSAWLQWFIDHRSPGLTTTAKAVSIAGDTTSVAIYSTLACVLLAWRRYWERAVLVAVTALGAGLLVFFGKLLVARDRPPVIDHLVTETNYSYPSGHALGSTVVVGILVAVALPVLRHRITRVLTVVVAVVFVVAVGLSRLYLGVHWPTDILAGWLIGLCWLSICLTARPAVAVEVRKRLAARRSTPDESTESR
ncbi:phosphatase PAP2 family protein [Nocardia yunnanensis]|uniref:Phosphatase PAP2 family protein n=1 Tax=Nocardia yunnanensis TaxID=2382165 RepID=A0A386ZNE2_9NOCA|nr:phosphatase PAP2 family protein [Nocardia yunnanensis]AYF78085.1 phosphatase PAP2 family protein [Nocardia yunnanensis]